MTKHDKNALIFCGIGIAAYLGILLFGKKHMRGMFRGYADVKDPSPSVIKGADYEGEAKGKTRSIRKIKTKKMQCVSPDFPGLGKFSQHTMLVRKDTKDAQKFEASEDIARYLRKQVETPQENFTVLYLNSQNKLLGTTLVSRGTATETLVDPPDVFRPAILSGAKRMVLAHNHPSGDITPSPQDVALTRRLGEASDTMGVVVLDHIVMGEGGRYTSMRDMGLMK